MIDVSNFIKAYPDPGEGKSGINSIVIKNHWSDPKMIVIMVEGCAINVCANDILAAINNSINTSRY